MPVPQPNTTPSEDSNSQASSNLHLRFPLNSPQLMIRFYNHNTVHTCQSSNGTDLRSWLSSCHVLLSSTWHMPGFSSWHTSLYCSLTTSPALLLTDITPSWLFSFLSIGRRFFSSGVHNLHLRKPLPSPHNPSSHHINFFGCNEDILKMLLCPFLGLLDNWETMVPKELSFSRSFLLGERKDQTEPWSQPEEPVPRERDVTQFWQLSHSS